MKRRNEVGAWTSRTRFPWENRKRGTSSADVIGFGIVCVIIIAAIAATLYFNVFPGIECHEAGGAWVTNAWGWYSCVKGN